MPATLPLSRSLAHVDSLLARARPGFGATLARGFSAGDPYFVDLPDYRGGLAGQVSAESLQVIAALYFAAEVEGTFLMSLGEELAGSRFTLNLRDREAALRLEELAEAISGDWVGRDLRNQIFARVFGIGYADPNLGDTAINREFEPRMARALIALLQTSGALSYPGRGASEAMRAGVAVQSLFSNLSGRMLGNTLVVAERLSQQLQTTLLALNHPGLAQLFRGANAWDVVRSVLGSDTPDLAGHINRAQTGLRLLGWMADHIPALSSANVNMIAPAVTSEPQLAGWAEIWLTAAGIDPYPQQATQNHWQQAPQYASGWPG